MDNSNNFTAYASKFLSSRILGASSGHSPIFHANYDDRCSNQGPWMNDDEIEQEMAHLQQSTLNRNSTPASESRSPSPNEHLNRSTGSQRSGVSTPDPNHINQAQSLFTNQSKLSFHKPPTPEPEPEPQEEIELQLSQPLLNRPQGDHNDDIEEDEQQPHQLFIQSPAPTPTVPSITRTPIRKYRDAPFIVTYGFSIISVISIGIFTLFRNNDTAIPPPNATPFITTTLLHSTPLLVALTTIALLLGAMHLIILKNAITPILYTAIAVILFGLLGSSTWAFAGSFIDDDESDSSWSSWWQSTGLRVFSLIPMIIIVWFSRTLYIRRHKLKRSIKIVELSSQVILEHPTLIIYHLGLTLFSTLLSIPYAWLVYKLLRIGHWDSNDSGLIWHVNTSSDLLVAYVILVGFWTWGLLRGIAAVTTSGVLGAWYFNRHDPHQPSPHIIVSNSFYRSTHASFGSICLASIILTTASLLVRVLVRLRNLNNSGITRFHPVSIVFTAISMVAAMTLGFIDHISNYALIHVGITGEAFTPSAKRVKQLVNRREVKGLMDDLLVKTTIRLFAITVSLLSAVAGFIYCAHYLNQSLHSPIIAIVAGWLTYSAIRMWCDLLTSTVDSVYVCYCFDVSTNQQHCIKASEAFGNAHQARQPV
ncbi:hypothetical protein E3P92_03833 [Wallemia ichthyophaga]|uniref:Protein PNS1 n=2 Tax=Wallemia ichthyophaga TaxID=245174 RepID=A0A4V4M7A7_WALIC|nr:Protein PNS1 [Wallemia ichthyophaga EXF-994]TIB08196.1 hypothetical protein E3P92_03833 [Wallemia ichthyophaga]EOQ99583.1 Protein PNS1 [Wallemia ichthyophaga EXF-994]TIB35629.1 hypothetical protein E3P84_01269 [Wallemia ichthyophaga]TIB38123.1 hypothetical protein E3P86_01813 [Wallemia ichthyophaga]TIB42554.1 hypothetical protein E3P83_01159 [Wallemia ichthyophaga]